MGMVAGKVKAQEMGRQEGTGQFMLGWSWQANKW